MTNACEVAMKQASGAPLGVFERYLTLWVFLCIVVGTGILTVLAVVEAEEDMAPVVGPRRRGGI